MKELDSVVPVTDLSAASADSALAKALTKVTWLLASATTTTRGKYSLTAWAHWQIDGTDKRAIYYYVFGNVEQQDHC
jgi:hypothetical protein